MAPNSAAFSVLVSSLPWRTSPVMNHAAELLVGVLFVFLVGRLSWLVVWVIEL
jgi:hypothetical protein